MGLPFPSPFFGFLLKLLLLLLCCCWVLKVLVGGWRGGKKDRGEVSFNCFQEFQVIGEEGKFLFSPPPPQFSPPPQKSKPSSPKIPLEGPKSSLRGDGFIVFFVYFLK